jgi:membrane protein
MPARIDGRARAVQDWLAERTDSPIGRLALQWFRRYFEASRNSGSAATIYLFLSVGPLLLAATGLFHAAGGDTNAVARQLINHQALTGDTATLVRQTFGTASSNALAASVAAVIGFLIWGIGIGQIYQDVYARAWRIEIRTLSDQARFAIWFFVLSALLALFFVFAGTMKQSGWALAIPGYLVISTAFWLGTPLYLLRRKIGLRPLLPGAVVASIAIGGATAVSPLFLGPWLNSDGKYFGSFGVVVALLAWGFILTTLSMVCAVFSPVWGEWRESERNVSLEPTGEPDAPTRA